MTPENYLDLFSPESVSVQSIWCYFAAQNSLKKLDAASYLKLKEGFYRGFYEAFCVICDYSTALEEKSESVLNRLFQEAKAASFESAEDLALEG